MPSNKELESYLNMIQNNPVVYSIEEIAESGITGYSYSLTKAALKSYGKTEYEKEEAKQITQEYASKGVN